MDDPKDNAATEPPPGHIDSLPTEIKTEIVHYLRLTRDKKALSLTSKSWAWISLPILWETLQSDFALTENRNICDLIQPASNIVKHVRNIQIPYTNGPRSIIWRREEDSLPALLAVLPRDRIRNFTSRSPQQRQSLALLLQFHRVENLHLEGACWRLITKDLHNTVRLPGLSRLVIEVQVVGSIRDEDYIVNVELLGALCPNLTHFEIQGHWNWGSPWICLSQEVGGSKAMLLSKLSHLILKNTYLETGSAYATILTKYFDVLRLHELVFHNVAGAFGALGALTRVFKTGNAQLQTFRLIDDVTYGHPHSVSIIQEFLMSFSGLRQLHIQTGMSSRLSASSIADHHCLRDLCLVNGHYHRSAPEWIMTASDLQHVATECPSIRYMSLNICEMAGSEGPLGTSKRQDLTEFESAMIALAELPYLSVLRLTNPANYRKSVRNAQRAKTNYQSRFNQSLKTGKHDNDFQILANRMLRYLRENGSKIELLVFAPVEKVPEPDKGFEDWGRFWPNYGFLRENHTDAKGEDVISMKNVDDLRAQFSGVAILEDLYF